MRSHLGQDEGGVTIDFPAGILRARTDENEPNINPKVKMNRAIKVGGKLNSSMPIRLVPYQLSSDIFWDHVTPCIRLLHA